MIDILWSLYFGVLEYLRHGWGIRRPCSFPHPAIRKDATGVNPEHLEYKKHASQ